MVGGIGFLLMGTLMAASAVDIVSNLVVHLDFAAGSGTVAHDRSGQGNDFTLANGASWAAAGIDGPHALAVNGENQYIYRENTGHHGGFTVATWLKTTHKQGSWVSESSPTNSGCDNLRGWLEPSTGAPAFYMWDNSAASGAHNVRIYATTSVADGRWHHIAATMSGGENLMALYVDGSLEASTSTPGEDGGYSRLWFGGTYGGCQGDSVINGLLDDIRFYHRALRAADIAQLTQRGRNVMTPQPPPPPLLPPPSPPPVDIVSNLVVHLDFAAGSGTVAHDRSGQGNDFTLANGASWAAAGIDGPHALAVNGENQYIYRENTGHHGGFTVATWLKTTHKQGSWVSESSPTNSGCDNLRGWLEPSTGAPAFYMWDNSAASGAHNVRIYATTSVADGRWHHIAATMSGGENLMALYVDGSLEASTSTPGEDGGYSRLWFGGTYGGCQGDSVINGLLDDIRFYHRALRAADIAQLTQRGRNVMTPQPPPPPLLPPPSPPPPVLPPVSPPDVPVSETLLQLMWEMRELRAELDALKAEKAASCGHFHLSADGQVCVLGIANHTQATQLHLRSKRSQLQIGGKGRRPS